MYNCSDSYSLHSITSASQHHRTSLDPSGNSLTITPSGNTLSCGQTPSESTTQHGTARHVKSFQVMPMSSHLHTAAKHCFRRPVRKCDQFLSVREVVLPLRHTRQRMNRLRNCKHTQTCWFGNSYTSRPSGKLVCVV